MDSERPRVLMLCETTLDTHFFRNVADGLRTAGLDVLFASMREPHPPTWVTKSVFEYFWLRAHHRWLYPSAIRALSRILRERKIDILHAHLHEATLLGAAVKKVNPRLRYVAGRHYTDQLSLLGKPWHVAMDRWATSVADAVTVPCQTTKEYLVKHESAVPDKVRPVYYGFDFEKFKACAEGEARVRKEFGLDEKFVIGCVARFMRLKGHDHLLTAFATIVGKVPLARLLLVGDGDAGKIKQQAKDLKIDSKVIFAGFRTDAPDCLAAMDVLVHPSLSEAFCQVIIEGMAVGRPVVATTVGGAMEVITDGADGILVPPRDPEAIARSVLRLLPDPKLRQRMGEAARSSVTQRFTVENMVKQHIQCYSHLFQQY